MGLKNYNYNVSFYTNNVWKNVHVHLKCNEAIIDNNPLCIMDKFLFAAANKNIDESLSLQIFFSIFFFQWIHNYNVTNGIRRLFNFFFLIERLKLLKLSVGKNYRIFTLQTSTYWEKY